MLSYERFGERFRIAIYRGAGFDESMSKPWSEWDRLTKLETVRFLPNPIGSSRSLASDAVVLDLPIERTHADVESLCGLAFVGRLP